MEEIMLADDSYYLLMSAMQTRNVPIIVHTLLGIEQLAHHVHNILGASYYNSIIKTPEERSELNIQTTQKILGEFHNKKFFEHDSMIEAVDLSTSSYRRKSAEPRKNAVDSYGLLTMISKEHADQDFKYSESQAQLTPLDLAIPDKKSNRDKGSRRYITDIRYIGAGRDGRNEKDQSLQGKLFGDGASKMNGSACIDITSNEELDYNRELESYGQLDGSRNEGISRAATDNKCSKSSSSLDCKPQQCSDGAPIGHSHSKTQTNMPPVLVIMETDEKGLEKATKSSSSTFPSRRPTKCNLCSKVVRADNFQVHLRNHTGEKPYRCPICPFRSANPSSMPKHLRLHDSGREIFQCPKCPYSTIYKSNLSAHRRSHSSHDIVSTAFYNKLQAAVST